MKDIIEQYLNGKVTQMCKNIGIKGFDLEIESWCFGYDPNAHFRLKPSTLDLEEFVDIADELGMTKECFILSTWVDEFYSVQIEWDYNTLYKDDKYLSTSYLDLIKGCDEFLDSGQADEILTSAKESVVEAANTVTDRIYDEIVSLQEEVYDNLQDFYNYSYQGDEDTPVRTKQTENFIVEVFEEPTDLFIYQEFDDEYIIEEIESFKDGKIVGFDLTVVVSDRHTKEELGRASIGCCTRKETDRPGFSEYVSELVSEAIAEARETINPPQKQIA